MKIASLLAGVAIVALSATAASAGPNIYQGSVTGSYNNFPISLNGTTNNTTVVGLVDALINPGVNSNIALITISGGAANNNGTASNTAGATFTLKGNVTKDCAYYTGNASTTVDFGTIGIYASDNTGPANAFDMTAPATVSIDTNLAGCNTSNTVTVTKSNANGLINSSGVGYDSNVFQANLPYTVKGTYTAGAVGSTAVGTSGNWIDVGLADQGDSNTHGAWKSAMSLDVVIPVPSTSLLAGNYQGDLTVAITAF